MEASRADNSLAFPAWAGKAIGIFSSSIVLLLICLLLEKRNWVAVDRYGGTITIISINQWQPWQRNIDMQASATPLRSTLTNNSDAVTLGTSTRFCITFCQGVRDGKLVHACGALHYWRLRKDYSAYEELPLPCNLALTLTQFRQTCKPWLNIQ